MYPALLRYMSILFLNILSLLASTQSADNLFHSFTYGCVCMGACVFVLGRACGCVGVDSRVRAFVGECVWVRVCVLVFVLGGACVGGFLCVYTCVCVRAGV